MGVAPLWGPHTPTSEGLILAIGTTRIGLRRVGLELRVAVDRGADQDVAPAVLPGALSVDDQVRLLVPPGAVRVRPQTADRAVVARVVTPLVVAPNASVQVFLSTPLWMDIGGVWDAPVQPSMRTWFGPSTVQGVLAYASRTRLRTARERLTPGPDRIFTSAVVRNLGSDPLRIERLLVPVERLALFADAQGVIWTQDVVYERTEGEQARVLLQDGEGTLLAEPRIQGAAADALWAFSSLRKTRSF
jgi:hypothetical protein